MEFLGNHDQLTPSATVGLLAFLSLYNQFLVIFLPLFFFCITVVRECVGLKVVVWEVRRGPDTDIMERLDK